MAARGRAPENRREPPAFPVRRDRANSREIPLLDRSRPGHGISLPQLTTRYPMKELLFPAVMTAISLACLPATAAGDPHAFSGKVALYSEYEYRGLAQTSEDPAIQLTLDYAHASGFYLGTFLSNVKWLEDTGEHLGIPTDAKLEWTSMPGTGGNWNPVGRSTWAFFATSTRPRTTSGPRWAAPKRPSCTRACPTGRRP